MRGEMWHIGCCGFPKARSVYFQTFRVVEVQQTFYDPPQPKTLRRWREEAGRDFIFTMKAWQLITHPASSPTYRRLRRPLAPEERPMAGLFQATPVVERGWAATVEAAQALKAAVVLLQCPASFTPAPEHLRHLEAFLERMGEVPFRVAWEPRGDWPDKVIRRICQRYGLIHAVDPFIRPPVTGEIAYFRLHGRTGYAYRYTDADLEELRDRGQGFREVFVLFNNVSMWEDALRFRQLVNSIKG
ncbi:MAG: DUF72 domain-containing protein [Anaerolineae bacterium]|uniref:DUF72 domain-containing protein n=2 Tax=Thermoflexus sp. TaxID=1969742 RepID=UPI0025D653E7|nr:DUF72 domain-containing protein [Thermoflexus sp.]MCS7351447.1 DUF72 domain-containing protein [Thermoflexus sp.]MDW8180904.1 DUF72 domain-containing protein [Anaerolineae bacterium]